MAKRVSDAMTPDPRSCSRGAPVVEAARLMRAEDVGSLPVVEGGRLVGVVTDRDIVLRVVAEGKDPQSVSVGEICSGDVVTVEPDQDLDEALRLMAGHRVRRLPVVEGGERLVGLVAQADLPAEAGDKKTGEVVAEISEPAHR